MINVALAFPFGTFSGMGHYNRANVLYNFLEKREGLRVQKFSLKDSSSISLQKKSHYLTKYFNKIFYNKKIDVIFIDFSSVSVIRQYKNIKKIIFSFSKRSDKKVIMIDSIKTETLYNKYCYKRVVPYYVKQEENCFYGFRYLIFDPRLLKIEKQKLREKLKVLITFGGADTKKTQHICKVISRLKKKTLSKIKIRIVVGNYCPKFFYDKVKKTLKKINNCEIIYGVYNNYKNYKWCNVVICGDGMTKYDVLASGKYALIVKSNKIKNSYGKDFENLNLFKFINKNHIKSENNLLKCLKSDYLKNHRTLTKKIRDFRDRYLKVHMNNYYNLIVN